MINDYILPFRKFSCIPCCLSKFVLASKTLRHLWDCSSYKFHIIPSPLGLNLINLFCRAPHRRIFLVLRRKLRRRLSRRNEYMAVKDQLLYILMSKLGTSISLNSPEKNSGGYISFSAALFWQYYSSVQFSTLFAYSTRFAQFHRQHFRYSTNIMLHL